MLQSLLIEPNSEFCVAAADTGLWLNKPSNFCDADLPKPAKSDMMADITRQMKNRFAEYEVRPDDE